MDLSFVRAEIEQMRRQILRQRKEIQDPASCSLRRSRWVSSICDVRQISVGVPLEQNQLARGVDVFRRPSHGRAAMRSAASRHR
jgi:hypothetical protein